MTPRRLASLLAFLLLAGAGCLHRPPRPVTELRRQLEAAREACAGTYAPNAIDQASALTARAEASGTTRHRIRARREARLARDAIAAALAAAGEGKEAARQLAAKAIEEAAAAIGRAGQAGGEAQGPGSAYEAELDHARTMLDDARRIFDFHPCEYPEAERIAGEASSLAGRAAQLAREFRQKRLEEARREAAKRRTAEEEARKRRAEEEAARHPERWTVTRGECLWLIASDPRVYGNPFEWPLLWRLNRGQIGDPDLIFPGQVFRIQRNSTPEEVESAIRRARERVWPTPNYLYDGR